jgi:hypothetical protein
VLAGCGSEEKRTIPVEDLVAAVDQTSEARSQRIHLETKMEQPGLSGELRFSGDGLMDNRTQKGRMTLDMSELAAASGGKLGDGDQKAEQIIDGFTFWMRWPAFSEQLGTDKEWVKFDLQKIGEQQGIDFNSLVGAQGDPTEQLDQLRATSGAVEVVGNETVRGVETTRYKATIDLRRYPDVVPASERDRVRRSVDRVIELTGQEEIPTEVWIGHETRRIHKSRFISEYEAPQGGGKVKQDVTMELYDFGAPMPPIEPPPESETADLAELAGAAGP